MLSAAATKRWFPIVDPVLSGRELADGILADRFTFNGETYVLPAGFDWTVNPSTDIEWLILLHKFYYAPALGQAWSDTGQSRYAHKWIELTSAWMDRVPVDFLTSDVAARRLQNWISAWFFFAECPLVPPRFRRRFLASIEQQTEWLRHNLTQARNHRTLELLALFFVAVALPELRNAEQWRDFAGDAIVENLQTDLRADGVHCEQSTDYHHIVLRNALIVARLARLNGIEMPDCFDEVIRGALEFALYIHRPDGLIPSLSDGDTGSYLVLLEQAHEIYGDARYLWVASQGRKGVAPKERLKAFPDGGYYILRSGWGEYERYEDERFMVFDCGPLGEGNHGHFDLLSFELYAYGRPLIVDPGRCTYDESGPVNWRVLFRGTPFHNTVTVDGRNQTRYEFHKRKFKVRGPAPEFKLLGFGTRDGYDYVRGRAVSTEYDVIHEREIRLIGGRDLLIVDELFSATAHRYDQIFQLAPDALNHLRIRSAAPAAMTLEQGWIAPSYGDRRPAPRMKFTQRGCKVRFETLVEVYP
jgi:hypothetical protein